ncbi:MAG TPA: hypothetical protein VL485_04025 [Ktedonobacteraceae bacterium]|nr:hypothetical protein [Ktedonobacteraceae bacterium]
MSSHANTASYPYTLSISLLKKFEVVIHTADGMSYRVPISPNAMRVQLLAYFAWKRDKIRIEKFLNGFFPVKGKAAQSAFHAHVRLVKGDIQDAIDRLNTKRGTDPLPTNPALFEHKKQYWWKLFSIWQVTDLEKVEAYARIVQKAERLSSLGPIPEHIRQACHALVAAYPGDFLEEMLLAYPEEFQPMVTSWVREPYTLYRENYLQALWWAAEDEWQRGKANADGQPLVHFDQSAKLFEKYAMYACNGRLDTRVYFPTEKLHEGPRVFMSEEALCRSLTIYKARGRTQDFETCKRAYTRQMERISRGVWKPGEHLREIIQSIIQ